MKLNLNKIIEIYGEGSIYEFQENIEDVVNNINYLSKKGFRDIYDIVETNPYLFLQPSDIFEEKIEKLIEKLGVEWIEKLEEDFSLWGEVDD